MRRSDDALVAHCAKLVIALFEPYCTPSGRAQLDEILAGEHDARIHRGHRAAAR